METHYHPLASGCRICSMLFTVMIACLVISLTSSRYVLRLHFRERSSQVLSEKARPFSPSRTCVLGDEAVGIMMARSSFSHPSGNIQDGCTVACSACTVPFTTPTSSQFVGGRDSVVGMVDDHTSLSLVISPSGKHTIELLVESLHPESDLTATQASRLPSLP
jgi:hypothetical protein